MLRKRLMSLMISAAMLICMAALLPITAAAETVEIFNDDFENGYGGWAGRGDAAISVVDTTANSGEKSLYISGRTKNWHGAACAKIKELRPGKTYYISGYVMQDEGNDSEQINLQILYKDSNGTEQYKSVSNVQAKKGEWTKVGGNYTVPSDATNVTVYFETPSNLINFYIDDVSATGEPNDDGDETEGFTEDFENGVNDWSGRGDAKCEVVSSVGHDGSSCLYTYNRQQLWNAPSANKTMVLNAGNYYRFSGWVMYKGEYKSGTETLDFPQTQKFSMYLQYQKDGKENYYEIASSTANIGEWTYIEGEYTLPETAANFVVYFQTGYKPDASVQTVDLMDFYIDDVAAELLPPPAIEEDIPSLCEAYSDYFKIGCASTATELQTNATKDLIKKHYNSLTLGNELKPDSTLNQKLALAHVASTGDDTDLPVDLANAAPLLEFSQENNIPVRGHVLVWHSQTPDWFFKENFETDGAWVSKEKMLKRLENYIKNIMTAIEVQYPDLNVYAWDVVNEAVKDSGGMRDPGSNSEVNGQSAWMKVFGDESFIDAAFEYARKYAPEGCKLFYNDYNEYTEVKRDDIYEICKRLADKGLIDGVGMQSHIKMSYPSVELYEAAIRKYASLGLEVQITELDIDQKSNSEESQLELAQRYKEVFSLYKSLKDEGVNITAVVLWGITDNTSWIGGYPLLFDKNYTAKPAFYAVLDTDKEVQTIKTASALAYDGTDSDYERAFKIQKSNDIGTAGAFRAIWNGNEVTLRIDSDVDGNAKIIFDGTDNYITKTASLNSGKSQDITIDLSQAGIKSGSSLGMEILIEDKSGKQYLWNTLEYSGSSDYVFGKLNFKEQPLGTTAGKAENAPVIDGVIDDIWASVESIDVNKYTMGKDGAYGTAKALWDKDNIYVLVEVKDSNLSKASANAYEQDTVEIFFDENNGKTTSYEADDIQIRVNFDNEVTVTDGKSGDIYKTAAKVTEVGYVVEVAIPHTIKEFEPNQVVGYDVQINDDNGEGKRTGIANWSDLTGQGYINTSGFGVLELSNGSANHEIGDVNADGTVNVADLVLLQKYIVHSVRDLDDGDAADMNSDNVISVFDAVLLRNKLLK
ncbi:MAG: endo-1,4-beta-xylanase [Oscillospiraceae bacterium]|nr:endo-1,4-beta-xylanase [Oscillospiraceae bacterium]